MLAPWALEEMKTADLNDNRLDARLTRLLSDLGERPTASIPAACGGFNEIMAAYRFFDNDKATYQNVFASHYERTREQMAEHPVVLLIQDTTELDFTRPSEQVKGVGPLDGSSRRGAFLPSLVGVHARRHAAEDDVGDIWTRDEAAEDAAGGSPSEKRKQCKEQADREEGELPLAQGAPSGAAGGSGGTPNAVRVHRRQ